MVVVKIGFSNFIFNTADAVAIAEMFSKAERYDRTYIAENERVDPDVEYIHHVHKSENDIEMRILPDHIYQAAKLVGRKSKD